MTRLRAGTLVALGVLAACGVITVPDVPFAPSNTCSANDDCGKAFPDASAACSSGTCVSNGAFVPIFVVTVPTTAGNGVGGATFARSSLFSKVQPAGCPSDNRVCVFLPPVAAVDNGFVLVSNGLARALWPPNGLRPQFVDTLSTTLPTVAIFHPMWIDPATNVPILATKLGLPLPDIFAIQRTQKSFGQTALLAPTNGTTQLPGFIFSANLPQPVSPVDPSTQYGFEVIPSEPFGVFPPLVRPLDPQPPIIETDAGALPPPDPTYRDGLNVSPLTEGLAPTNVDLGFSNVIPFYDLGASGVETTPIVVNEGPGGPSLEGWSMYAVDAENRRVSGRVMLPAGASKSLTLYEAPNMIRNGQTLVIAPPPTLDMPRITEVALNGVIASPVTYFKLPQVAAISGSVIRADTFAKTSARVTFFADGTSAILIHDDQTPAAELNYQKVVASDTNGNYATTLPPGSLTAYVVPDDPELAITANSVTVATDLMQAGKTLTVNPRTHVKGQVVLADGAPLYAAEIVISASADAPFSKNDPLTYPRESHGFTDISGNFDVPSDPGQVDISIRPQDGTRYPWVVLTNHAVVANASSDGGTNVTLMLPTITIPLPTPFPQTLGVLTDYLGNPLPHAVVQTFAFPPAVNTPDGGVAVSRGARMIGATVTDSTGSFQLFVAPPDSE